MENEKDLWTPTGWNTINIPEIASSTGSSSTDVARSILSMKVAEAEVGGDYQEMIRK